MRRTVILLALIGLTLAVSACDRIPGLSKPKPEKPGPYAFDLTLRLSPKAAAAMKQTRDSLIVAGFYYGDAQAAYRKDADDLNRIHLGEERWGYSGDARKLHMHGEPIDTSKLSETRDGQPQVLVTVYSIRPIGEPDDMLSCHHYIGSIRLAQQHTQVLDCQLDSENLWDNSTADASSQ